MALKTRRTEHAGYLTGSDGQKEYDDKGSLKWDSNRRRRIDEKYLIRDELEALPDIIAYMPC